MSKERFKLKLSKLFIRNRSEREKYLLSYIGVLIDERDSASKEALELELYKGRSEELYRDNQVMAGATQERSERIQDLEGKLARKDHEIQMIEKNLDFSNDQIDGYKQVADESERKYNELSNQFDERIESEKQLLKDIHSNQIAEIYKEQVEAGIQFEDILTTYYTGNITRIFNHVRNHKGAIKKADLLEFIKPIIDERTTVEASKYFGEL